MLLKYMYFSDKNHTCGKHFSTRYRYKTMYPLCQLFFHYLHKLGHMVTLNAKILAEAYSSWNLFDTTRTNLHNGLDP